MTKILITGSNGFVGRYVKSAASHNYEVLGFHQDKWDEVINFAPDTVINLAWAGVNQFLRYDIKTQAQNLIFSEKLFDVCKSTCKSWIGIGSQLETNCPKVPYAIFKNKVRAELESRCRDANILHAWVRIFSIYGPGDAETNYIPYLIRELKAGKDPELTDQNIPWDYLYVNDAAKAILLVATNSNDGVFELGSGSPTMTQDVAKMVRDKINAKATLQFGKRPKRNVELDYLCADIHRLRELGWSPETSLSDGLDQTIEA